MSTIDARGRRCPYPIVALGRAAASAAPGSAFELLSDDPVSLTDVPAWCRMRNATLAATVEHDGYWSFQVITGLAGDR